MCRAIFGWGQSVPHRIRSGAAAISACANGTASVNGGPLLEIRSAPEIFCLDLYKYFDLDRLSVMAEPTEVKPTAKEKANGNTENLE